MVDNWMDCPRCGTNVSAITDRCSRCGGDLRVNPDGAPNPGRINPYLKALQIGGSFDRVFVAVGIVVLFLMLLDAF